VNSDQGPQWVDYYACVPYAKALVTLLKSPLGSLQALQLTKHSLLQHSAKETQNDGD